MTECAKKMIQNTDALYSLAELAVLLVGLECCVTSYLVWLKLARDECDGEPGPCKRW